MRNAIHSSSAEFLVLKWHPPTLENIILVRLVYSTPFTLKLSVHGHFNDEKLTKLIKKKYANKSIAIFFFFNDGHFIDLKKISF